MNNDNFIYSDVEMIKEKKAPAKPESEKWYCQPFSHIIFLTLKSLYPTDVPHSEKKCTPRVPHSRPAQLATLPMIEQGRQLAFLLSSLAQQVFHLPLQSIHLFRDIDSGTN